MSTYRILVINIGSTSTKLAVYDAKTPQFVQILRHSKEELTALDGITGQYLFRKRVILQALTERGFDLATIDAVVGRGGMTRPLESGTYSVSQAMFDDLLSGKWGVHPVNLSGILAHELGTQLQKPAFIVDPVVVDEMEDIARITGFPGLERSCAWHALNQKAMARRYAAEIGRPYSSLNLIVAHIGGGITVGAHRLGRVVDVNNAVDGDGPFSAERPGGLPVGPLMRLCYSGKYPALEDLRRELVGRSGLTAYLGTNDGREVGRRIKEGDAYAELVYRAMAYQIAKEIGACGAVLCGKVDAVILTGGLSYDPMLTGWITERIRYLAPVKIYPGEDEVESLALGALRVLTGEEQAKVYRG